MKKPKVILELEKELNYSISLEKKFSLEKELITTYDSEKKFSLQEKIKELGNWIIGLKK